MKDPKLSIKQIGKFAQILNEKIIKKYLDNTKHYLTFPVIGFSYRKLNNKELTHDKVEIISVNQINKNNLKNILIKKIHSIYAELYRDDEKVEFKYSPNFLLFEDLVIAAHKEITDLLHQILKFNGLYNCNLLNIIGETYLNISNSNKIFSNKYLPNVHIVELKIFETIPFGFNIREILTDVFDRFGITSEENYLYTSYDGKLFHMLLMDIPGDYEVSYILNPKKINNFCDILRKEIFKTGIEKFDIDVHSEYKLTHIPGTYTTEGDLVEIVDY